MGSSHDKKCTCSCNTNSTKDNDEIKFQNQPKGIIKSKDKSLQINGSPSSSNDLEPENKLPRRLLNSSSLAVINEQYSEMYDGKYNKNRTKHLGHKLNPSFSSSSIFRGNNNKDNMSNRDGNSYYMNKNNIFSETLNENWRQMGIANIISDSKLLSNDPKEIMVKGCLNKLIISHLFKNCSTNVEKFCILTKQEIDVYKSKENCLLMGKPQQSLKFNEIIGCNRIDFDCLNLLKLQGKYFFYIEIKHKEPDNSLNNKNTPRNDENDVIKEIIQREKEERFFVFFSTNEYIINQWVCIINYFLNKSKEN